MRLLVQVQQIFHVPDELASDLWNAPLFLQPGLQLVFLNTVARSRPRCSPPPSTPPSDPQATASSSALALPARHCRLLQPEAPRRDRRASPCLQGASDLSAPTPARPPRSACECARLSPDRYAALLRPQRPTDLHWPAAACL